MQSSPLIVAVRPGSALSARRRLFAALAEAFGVAFRDGQAGGRFDAVIDLGAEGAPDDGVPVLACAAGAATSAERVQMTGAATLDRRLRGLALSTPIAGPAPGGPHADVLATAGTSAVWTRSRGPLPRYGLGVAPPELEPGEGALRAAAASGARARRARPVPARAHRNARAGALRRRAPRSSSTTRTCAGAATASSTTGASSSTPTSTATTPRWR